ncbi:TetR/AcrR family transcriptional regulator [Citromicrobium bathyomarinum]|uniref:TetR/AcrR family transcriptional regulator n=1 Tax=Sphingomonadales TaxID=204457 RepID=UPI000C49A153|nr:TetR/AcrR family transcriptional regulator [Citromicrobium sp.]MBO81302.1 TetR family transcriptional regulator [Citromicrobium sp.]
MTELPEFCRLDRRKRAIVDAARSLFAEQGYERTTLKDIVDRAGGSLATVYKVFGNKDGLLEAVVFEKAASGEVIVQRAVAAGGTPQQILHRIGEGLRLHFLDPEVVALVRIVVARSLEDADFARTFHERTATRTRDSLRNLFARWKADGTAMAGTPDMLAEMLLGLFVSDLHTDAISHGAGADHTEARLRARIDFFIRGAGLADDGGGAPDIDIGRTRMPGPGAAG